MIYARFFRVLVLLASPLEHDQCCRREKSEYEAWDARQDDNWYTMHAVRLSSQDRVKLPLHHKLIVLYVL